MLMRPITSVSEIFTMITGISFRKSVACIIALLPKLCCVLIVRTMYGRFSRNESLNSAATRFLILKKKKKEKKEEESRHFKNKKTFLNKFGVYKT